MKASFRRRNSPTIAHPSRMSATENNMPSILEQCFAITVGTEGLLSMDPKDKGNWTGGKIGVGELRGSKFGMSAASFPNRDIANLTLADAAEAFDVRYFTFCGCDGMPGPVACLVADSAYNNGPGNAVRFLQQTVGTKLDGKVGPITLAAIASWHGRGFALLSRYQAIRLRFMAGLADWDHNAGWADRLCTVLLASTQIKDQA